MTGFMYIELTDSQYCQLTDALRVTGEHYHRACYGNLDHTKQDEHYAHKILLARKALGLSVERKRVCCDLNDLSGDFQKV